MIRFDRSVLRSGVGRPLLLGLLEAGLAAADAGRAVSESLATAAGRLRVGAAALSRSVGRLWLIAIGKAAIPMAGAAVECLGDRLAGGIALTRHGYGGSIRGVRVHEAGHPIPDVAGLHAGGEIGALCDRVAAEDTVLCLLSGGGSALLAAPPPGVSLDDLARTTGLLIGCGATIDEVNTVRRHLSALQGGRLARRLAPARVVTLALSDVVGDHPEAIASGPTVADPTSVDDAIRVLRDHRLVERVPRTVRGWLKRGADAETVKPGDSAVRNTAFAIVGRNATLLDAVEQAGREAGCHVLRETEPILGEARDAGRAFGRRVADLASDGARRTVLVAGGETTVTVTGDGRGGRNQEFALAAALELSGIEGGAVVALASDGSDGVTDAAGAIVDGSTVERIERAGLDPHAALAGNDTYTALRASRDVLFTGPTRTNVADAYVGFLDTPRMGAR